MATSSPLNRGYSGGLAGRGATSTRTPPQNRGYSGGLAAGSRPGGGFRPSFQSNFQASMTAPAARPQAGAAAPSATAPAPYQAPAPYSPPATPATAPDAFAPWNQQPLPQLGQQTFNQQPASPFGPAPLPTFGGFRANGGPVQPGQAYVVGEEGPEVIVPQQPGMVVPNGSISSRPARPVGRSMYDLERVAEQRYRRTKNPDMLMRLDYQNQRFAGRQGGQEMSRGQIMPPAVPAAPAGHWVPGRSTGSQVWVRDDLPAPAAPALAQPSAPAPAAPVPMQAAPEQPQAPGLPGTFSPPLPPWMQPQQPATPAGAAFNPQAPLPPSPLGNYIPPQEPFFNQTVGGWEVLGANTPTGPKFMNARPVPSTQPETLSNVQQRMLTDYNARNPQAPLQWSGKFEANGVPVLAPLTQDGKPPQFKQDKDSGKWFWFERGEKGGYTQKWVDEDGDGVVSPEEAAKAAGGKGGYFDTLMQPAAGAAKPQASAEPTATGQMPNVAYANPINPEQQLAAARDEYARTGNDAAIRAYFKENPSASVQKYQQASALLTQLGEQIAATDQTAQQRQQQHLDRDAYINANAGSPLGQGYAAEEYDQNFPDRVNRLAGPHDKADYKLLEDAMRLAREADIAAGRNSPALSPANVPLPPVLPRTQADRNPQGLAAKLARMPVGRLPVMPVRLRSAS